MYNLHHVVLTCTRVKRDHVHGSRNERSLANVSKVDYVLVARDQYFEGEKLYLHWLGLRRVAEPMIEYVYKFEDIWNGNMENIIELVYRFIHRARSTKRVLCYMSCRRKQGYP